jgi:hypothetical protein
MTGEQYFPLVKFEAYHPLTGARTTFTDIDDFCARLDLCKPYLKDTAEFIKKQLSWNKTDESKALSPYKLAVPRVGEDIWMYSYDPNGNLKVCQGVIHSEPVEGWFRHTCQSVGGDSGAPIFNAYGSIVGMHKGAIQEGVYNCMLGFTLEILVAIRDNIPYGLKKINFIEGRPL